MSPASTSTMSPTTTSRAGTCTMCPPRTTRVCGTCIFDSASTLALALSFLGVLTEDDVERDEQRDEDPGRHLADGEAARP